MDSTGGGSDGKDISMPVQEKGRECLVGKRDTKIQRREGRDDLISLEGDYKEKEYTSWTVEETSEISMSSTIMEFFVLFCFLF